MSRINRKEAINFGIVVVVFLFLDKILAFISGLLGEKLDTGEQQQQQQNIDTTQGEINTKYLSYPQSEYFDIADTIYTALQNSYFVDEESIYDAFRLLKTNPDYLQLKVSYGERPHGFYGFRVDKNLVQSLRSDLDEEEIDKVNKILEVRNIKYRL